MDIQKEQPRNRFLHPPPIVFCALNTVLYIFMVTMNSLANVVKFGGETNGSISAANPTRFTPAGFAFSIWGLIFAALGVFVVYSWVIVILKREEGLPQLSYFFVLNMIINGMWSVVFAFKLFWLAEFLIILIGVTIAIMYKLCKRHVNSATGRIEAPLGPRSYTLKQIAMYWCLEFPFALYLAWVSVATVANSSITFKDWGWNSQEELWSVLMQVVVTTLSAVFCAAELDAPFPGVVAWALFAISRKNSEAFDGMSKSTTVATTATVLAAVNLALCVITILVRVFAATSLGQLLRRIGVLKHSVPEEDNADV